MPLFLCRLVCYILNLAKKHGITLIPAYIPTHLSVEADYLLWGRLAPEWHLFFLICLKWHFNFGVNQNGIVNMLMYQSMLALLYLGESTTSGSLGVKCFQPTLGTLDESYIFYSYITPPILSQFQVEHVTGQFRLLM